MLEIVFALGIISIAILPLIGMLPSGIKNHKRAVINNTTSNMAETMISFLEYQTSQSWVAIESALDESLPSPAAVGGSPLDAGWVEVDTDLFPNLYWDGSSPKVFRYYLKNFGSTGTSKAKETKDVNAYVSVWKSKAYYWNSSGSTLEWTEESDFSERMILNIEISWPASAEYSNRFKELYTLEISNDE